MGYLKIYLDDMDIISEIIRSVSQVDIQSNPLFKTSKNKLNKSRYLASLLLQSSKGKSLHKDDAGRGTSSFASRALIKDLGKDYKRYLEPLYHFTSENFD